MSWLPKKCVVVPYDFSERSGQAIEIARDLVADLTNLHLIHVLSMITASDPGMVWDVVDNDARKRDAERAFREGFAASPFHKSDFHVSFGDPGNEIAAFAERLQADLIVMPSHGRSGVTRLLIGSVAERVCRLAHCPVLVLRGLSGKRP
ncbi:MAG TPA: universal stress protein [Planctomycetaceae bacterium]|jgi:nucleotide-binding universal stress UspA family protein|nr:universal stress protein [Planctomycetaceae bacterium]